jgi:hypothetical protein
LKMVGSICSTCCAESKMLINKIVLDSFPIWNVFGITLLRTN